MGYLLITLCHRKMWLLCDLSCLLLLTDGLHPVVQFNLLQSLDVLLELKTRFHLALLAKQLFKFGLFELLILKFLFAYVEWIFESNDWALMLLIWLVVSHAGLLGGRVPFDAVMDYGRDLLQSCLGQADIICHTVLFFKINWGLFFNYHRLSSLNLRAVEVRK